MGQCRLRLAVAKLLYTQLHFSCTSLASLRLLAIQSICCISPLGCAIVWSAFLERRQYLAMYKKQQQEKKKGERGGGGAYFVPVMRSPVTKPTLYVY